VPRDHPLIIVANDDPVYLELMRKLLIDAGYRALCMSINVRAYEAVRVEKPDLVVLDIPVENLWGGWGLLELIRLDTKTMHIPMLLCSANTQLIRDSMDRLRSLGCDVLQKPFNADQLLEKVRAAIGSPPSEKSVP
jgi:DNA-binding response OmpR family regulator